MSFNVFRRATTRLRAGALLAVTAVVAVATGTMAVTAAPSTGAASTGVVKTTPTDWPTVDRWGGADRYEVSANISKTNFPSGADAIYVANGLASADALAAGPVAGMSQGPILLVKKDSIPATVGTEVARLDPSKIVILGGTGSVSDIVAGQLGRVAPVVRWAGADRYAVSANISRVNFPAGAETVYVANGLASADALAAGPVAGMNEGPILLVRKDSIPALVATELDRLNPTKIVVLGGTGSVASTVEATLATKADSIVRWAGPDRYAVSANVSRANFSPGVEVVYLANGLASADALAAGPVAANTPGPILLMRKDSIPPTVRTELERLDPDKIIILGGPGSVSAVPVIAPGPDPLPDRAVNILLAGTDEPSLDGAADSIMLLHIPGDRSKLYLISFPRDMLVHIVGWDSSGSDLGKINASYAYGGTPMLTNTVTHLLADRVEIDYSLVADFASFTEISQWLGTVEVDNQYASTVGTLQFPSGMITLTEQNALTYVRDRATLPNSDLDRAERHRATLTGVLDRLKEKLSTDPFSFPTLVTNLYDNVEFTGSLSLTDIVNLTPLMDSMTRADVVSLQAPIDHSGSFLYPPYTSPQSVHFVDWEQIGILGTALQTDTMAKYVATYGTAYPPIDWR